MTKNIFEISDSISGNGYFSSVKDGIILIREEESGSEYIGEIFGYSLQIRQTVCLYEEADLDQYGCYIYEACSKINCRFSGCKNYVDDYGALITASDIICDPLSGELIRGILNQVEFISQSIFDIFKSIPENGMVPSEKDIDAALEVKPAN